MARSFNLSELFEVVADAVPDRVALVAGDRRLTYGELDERATRLAHVLAERGVGPSTHVAVYSWNRSEWLETMLAAFKLSAVPINVNYRYVAAELEYVLADSDSTFVVLEPEFADTLAAVAANLPKMSGTLTIGDEYERALAGASSDRDFAGRSGDDRYLLYTGGTTGMPKGVVWRHEDIFFAALGGGGFGLPPIEEPDELAPRLGDEAARSISMVNAPVMHGGGQWTSFITWYSGGTVLLNCGRHFDAHEVWRTVERERANSVMVVGDAMARPLAEALAEGGYDASSVFVIGSGGGILSKAVKEQLRAHAPNALVMDSFGASETGAGGTVMDVGAPAAGPRFTMNESMTVLGDDLRPVVPGSGVTGRLARRGHIPLGYYGDDTKTAATFVVDPDGVRWVIPGDAATIEADSTITLFGRGNVSINTGGEKVYPEEVEAALKSHPDVYDAVVVGVPDERFVERVAAVVAPREGAQPTLESLQAHCATQIARYKQPRQLVVCDRIERTPVGKPDYRWAKRIATAAPPPD